MSLSHYSIGTITLTNGSDAFTVAGAYLQTLGVREDDILIVPGFGEHWIKEITGQGAGKLFFPWPHASQAGVPYIIFHNPLSRITTDGFSRMMNAQRDINAALAGQPPMYRVLGAAPDDGIGADGQIAFKTENGAVKLWAKDGGTYGAPLALMTAFANNGSLFDTNANELLTFGVTAAAVNQFKVTNAAAGGAPRLEVVGNDTNISARYATKGTGSHIWQVNAIDELELSATYLRPFSNGGLSLGDATHGFDALNLSNGAVIRINNAYTITHSSGLLTVSGAVSVGDKVTLTGVEGSQLEWNLGGAIWRGSVAPGGNWYLFNGADNRFPLVISRNAPTSSLSLSTSGAVIGVNTVATSTTTGSLINAGGFGNAGNAYIGGNIVCAGSNITIGTPGGDPTYTGALRLLTQGGLATNTGLEFRNAAGGSGYGWKMVAPDLGGQNTPLIIGARVATATWTEVLRLHNSRDVTISTAANTAIVLGRWAGDGAYNCIAVNGDFGVGTAIGIVGGKTADASLYYMAQTGGQHDWRINNASIATLSGTRMRINLATAATSTTDGSLVNAGGFGNAGAAYIGGYTSIGGALDVVAGTRSQGGFVARNIAATWGYATLMPGDATHTGHIEWRKADTTRLGYLGWDNSNVKLTLENAAQFVVEGVTSLGSIVYSGYGVSTGDVAFEIGGARTGSGHVYLDLHATVGADYEMRILRQSGANGIGGFYHRGTGALSFLTEDVANILFGTSNTTRVTVYADGGVAIGSPTGGSKGVGTLNVAGDIYKNNTAYTSPDYVFERHYTGKIERFAQNEGAAGYRGLMSLDDLRTYTRAHLRLPGISDDGIGIFARSDIILEKFEELTLYTLDIHERQNSQQTEIVALKARVTELESTRH